jgi:hypothetical protein
MFSKTEWYIFILAALTLSLVYYVGLKSDAGALQTAFTGAMDTIMGRNSSGVFQTVTQ